ncbi:hypothetical protein ABZ446_42475 [Streptomyces sp. NPDC005813]|uniref:hypothetical protein n=1 Tax=Streptomyces sp. NPDC005813 TaxID=3155592 RepID=UPI0034080B9A
MPLVRVPDRFGVGSQDSGRPVGQVSNGRQGATGLLIPEPEKVHRSDQEETVRAAVGSGTATPKAIPKRRDGRSLPPE